jgi:hypothetical protein
MSAEERLSLIRVKIERAKKHFHDLQAARTQFMEGTPYRIDCEHNAQSGYNLYRVFDIQAPPAEIGLITGDVIHNLRSALDHLAYQLVLVNGSTPSKQTAFPIWDNASDYHAQRARRVTGMAQAAIDAIDVFEPYQLGKGAGLWVLHYLDIADKHHALLTPLINVTEASFMIPGYWERNYKGVGGISFPNFKKPLHDGDVVATREAEMDKDLNLTLDIAFTEPDVIEGRAIVKTLDHLIVLVDDVITGFRPMLS